MKNLLFAIVAMFCISFCNAQHSKKSTQKPISNTTVQTDLRGKVSSAKIANGNVKIHTQPGKYDVYVTYKNNKVADFYAIDTKGNKIPATYKDNGNSGTVCTACIHTKAGLVHCYEINCGDLPTPKPDAVKKQ